MLYCYHYDLIHFYHLKKPCPSAGKFRSRICTIPCKRATKHFKSLPGRSTTCWAFFVAFGGPVRSEKLSQNNSKRWRSAGSKEPVWCHVGGKGQNHYIPHRKGVRRWKLFPATMANSAGLMLFAKPYCEMRPETTTGI